MRKWLVLACLFMFTAAAAQTPDQFETVNADDSALVGIWQFRWPEYGLLTGATWGPLSNRFCRIDRAKSAPFEIFCFTRFQMGDGTVRLDDAGIHFAWGGMMVRYVFDGTVQAPTRMTGRMGVKVAGFLRTHPEPVNPVRFIFSQAPPDKAGKAALLRTALTQLAQGKLVLPHDEGTIMGNLGGLPRDVRALGAIHAIAYLGQSPHPLGTKDVDFEFFSVYAIEYDGGERLCGLHQRPDGVIDGFRCI